MAGEDGALALGVAMVVAVGMLLLAFLFVTFATTVGQRTFVDHLGSLVISKIFTCQRITILENLVVLALCNLLIQPMLQRLNITWMVRSFLAVS